MPTVSAIRMLARRCGGGFDEGFEEVGVRSGCVKAADGDSIEVSLSPGEQALDLREEARFAPSGQLQL